MKVDLSSQLQQSLVAQPLDAARLRRVAEVAGQAVWEAYVSGENSVGEYRVIDGHGMIVNCQAESRSKGRTLKPSALLNRRLWRAKVQSMEPSKAVLAVFAECRIDQRRKLVTVMGLSCTPRSSRVATLDRASLERERGELLHRKYFEDGLSEVEETLLSL